MSSSAPAGGEVSPSQSPMISSWILICLASRQQGMVTWPLDGIAVPGPKKAEGKNITRRTNNDRHVSFLETKKTYLKRACLVQWMDLTQGNFVNQEMAHSLTLSKGFMSRPICGDMWGYGQLQNLGQESNRILNLSLFGQKLWMSRGGYFCHTGSITRAWTNTRPDQIRQGLQFTVPALHEGGRELSADFHLLGKGLYATF